MTPAQERLVSEHQGLVRDVMRRYFNFQKGDYQDVFQEGCIGLMQAAIQYDPKRGFKFSTLAHKIIRNHLAKHFRKQLRHSGPETVPISKPLVCRTSTEDIYEQRERFVGCLHVALSNPTES